MVFEFVLPDVRTPDVPTFGVDLPVEVPTVVAPATVVVGLAVVVVLDTGVVVVPEVPDAELVAEEALDDVEEGEGDAPAEPDDADPDPAEAEVPVAAAVSFCNWAIADPRLVMSVP